MYRTETNALIGDYIGNLIIEKYSKFQRFAVEYIKLRDNQSGKPDPAEVQRLKNKLCQIKKGNKGIQITDLPLIAELLDVSVDDILSAGKVSKPVMSRMTNYSVSFSKDEEEWVKYINHPDKLILNEDEYGKSVIDYALEHGNYEFLKFLIDKNYIYFTDHDKQEYRYCFGAGTNIGRREPNHIDYLEWKIKTRDDLRTSLIALALNKGDESVLSTMKAREIPAYYKASYYMIEPLGFKQYYNKKLMNAIIQASDEVLLYFSEEFEITSDMKVDGIYTFPYLGELIEMAIQKDRKAVPRMLKNALKHNQMILSSLKRIENLIRQSLGELCNIMSEEAIMKKVMDNFQYMAEDDTVAFEIWSAQDNKIIGIFSNTICINSDSKDAYVNSLIEDVNSSYAKIKNFGIIDR